MYSAEAFGSTIENILCVKCGCIVGDSDCSECDDEKEMSMSDDCTKEYNDAEENEEELDQPLLATDVRGMKYLGWSA